MFRLVKILAGRENVAEPELASVTASETYKTGEALILKSGVVTKCGATENPTHIAAEDYVAPASGARKLTVYAILPGMVFECPVGATPTSLTEGALVTLASDAMGVTATTTNGVAKIYSLCGAAASGDRLLVTL